METRIGSTSTGESTLVLLPGLTAEVRLLEPQRQAFQGLIVPPWIEPRPRESLPHYARRMACTLERESG